MHVSVETCMCARPFSEETLERFLDLVYIHVYAIACNYLCRENEMEKVSAAWRCAGVWTGGMVWLFEGMREWPAALVLRVGAIVFGLARWVFFWGRIHVRCEVSFWIEKVEIGWNVRDSQRCTPLASIVSLGKRASRWVEVLEERSSAPISWKSRR